MIDTYSKPLILADSELAEGVYTSSGSGSVGYSIKLESDWGDGGKVYRLDIDTQSLTTSDSWSITLTISGGTVTGISVYDGRLTGTLSGSTITISGTGGVYYYDIGLYVNCGSDVTVS
ncbi:MAG: hypothetical protein LUI39_11275 [Lachnospiraceae bacterium]|nr:hypothetical protein [Lachnospiraceae bacterium]